MQQSSSSKQPIFIIKEGSNQKISQNFSQPHQQKVNLQPVQIKTNFIRNQIPNNQKPISNNQIQNILKVNQKQEFASPQELYWQQVTNDKNQQQFNYYNNQNFQNKQEQQRLSRVSSQPPNPKIKIINKIQNEDDNMIRNQITNNYQPFTHNSIQNILKAKQKQEFPSIQDPNWQQVTNDKIEQQQNIYQNNYQNFENEFEQQRQIRISSQPVNVKIKIMHQIQNGQLIQYNGQKLGQKLNDEQQKFLQKSIQGYVKVNNVSQQQPLKPGSPLKQQVQQLVSSKQIRQHISIRQDSNESFQSVTRTQCFKCIHCNQNIQSNYFNLSCLHEYHDECFKEFIQFQAFQKDTIKLKCHCNHYISLKVIKQISSELVEIMLKKQLQIIKGMNSQRIQQCNSCDYFFFSKNQTKINLSCPYCQNRIQSPAIKSK